MRLTRSLVDGDSGCGRTMISLKRLLSTLIVRWNSCRRNMHKTQHKSRTKHLNVARVALRLISKGLVVDRNLFKDELLNCQALNKEATTVLRITTAKLTEEIAFS